MHFISIFIFIFGSMETIVLIDAILKCSYLANSFYFLTLKMRSTF